MLLEYHSGSNRVRRPLRQRCRHLDRRLRPFLSERNRYSAVRQTASCAPPGRVAKPPKVPMAHRLNCRGNSPRRHRRNMRAKSNVCVGRHASNGPQLGWGQCPAMASPTSLVCGHRHSCSLPVGRSSSTPVVARRLSTPTPCLSSPVAWTQLATETVAHCWAAASRAGKPPLWSSSQSSRR